MHVIFERDWFGCRAGESYQIATPVAELLIRRGFAKVTKPQRNKPKGKSANGGSQSTRTRKRATGNRTDND